MPQIVQTLDAGVPYIPSELAETNSEKIPTWASIIRSAHVTGEKATVDNYLDVGYYIYYIYLKFSIPTSSLALLFL